MGGETFRGAISASSGTDAAGSHWHYTPLHTALGKDTLSAKVNISVERPGDMGIEKQLIRLDDGKGILVEVEVDTSQPVLAANLGEVWDVQKSFDTISAFLEKALLPFLHTWQDLSQKVEISEAALKLSVGV